MTRHFYSRVFAVYCDVMPFLVSFIYVEIKGPLQFQFIQKAIYLSSWNQWLFHWVSLLVPVCMVFDTHHLQICSVVNSFVLLLLLESKVLENKLKMLSVLLYSTQHNASWGLYTWSFKCISWNFYFVHPWSKREEAFV